MQYHDLFFRQNIPATPDEDDDVRFATAPGINGARNKRLVIKIYF
jgi:hypothetical protein